MSSLCLEIKAYKCAPILSYCYFKETMYPIIVLCSFMYEDWYFVAGVVLGRHGGMIKQMYIPFFFGLGGPIGNGKQYLPWIHVKDLCNMFIFAIENKSVSGVLNGVAPQVFISYWCYLKVKFMYYKVFYLTMLFRNLLIVILAKF